MDVVYGALLENDGTFAPTEEIRYVEAWTYTESEQYDFRPGSLPEENVLDWLNQTGRYEAGWKRDEKVAGGLRLLLCKANLADDYYSDSSLPIFLTRSTFEIIMESMRLPKSYLTVLSQGTAICTKIPASFKDETQDHKCYIIHNNGSSGDHFSAALRYERSTNTTTGLIVGVHQGMADKIISDLPDYISCIGLPTLIPIICIERKATGTKNHVDQCRHRIHEVERQTSIERDAVLFHRPGHVESSNASEGANIASDDSDIAPPDLTAISRTLTSVTAKLAHCNYNCQLHISMLDFIDTVNQNCVEAAPQEHRERLTNAEKILTTKTAYLRYWLTSIRERTTYLSQRSQAQVQTVYSLIAQNDNALNIRMAEASLRIAESSQRDSAAMKAIAEISNEVALNTSMDSAAMRAIAAVTILFLPATFTATLFSTSFFNFQAPHGGRVVSRWHWLYWLVTVLLTVIVHAAWWLKSRRKEIKIMAAFGRRDETLQAATAVTEPARAKIDETKKSP